MIQYKLAVIGNPIAHSISPQLFEIFAHQYDIHIEFNKILATADNFNKIATEFFANGGSAIAVTSPFKPLAYKLASNISANSLACGSANLLYMENNHIIAENTDGLGLVKDLQQRMQIDLVGAALLILGSGGVVSSIIPALIESGVASISINARNTQQIKELQNKFPLVKLFDENTQYTGLINTTPNTLDNQLFDQRYNLQKFVYDMSYLHNKTICIKKILMRQPNLLYSNGLGMLVMQAYFSFKILFGLEPDVVNTYFKLNTQTD